MKVNLCFLSSNCTEIDEILTFLIPGTDSFSHPDIPKRKQKETKRYRKHFKTTSKPQRQNKLRNHKKIEHPIKKTLRAHRESNQATIEDDQYTIVKPDDNDQDLNHQDKYLEDGGMSSITQSENNELLSGVHMSFSNTTDLETVVNFNTDRRVYKEEDKIAQLVSFCIKDVQCSNHASCIRTSLMKKGFCRCLPGYYGPGIFCREDM